MAKLITILTKQPWDQWIYNRLSQEENFTQQEYNLIVQPYENFINSLPGIDSSTIQLDEDKNQRISTRFFDTLENAEAARDKLLDNSITIVRNMGILLNQKHQEAGVKYTRDIRAIE